MNGDTVPIGYVCCVKTAFFKKGTGGIIMKHKFAAVLLSLSILITACAHQYRPIVDFQGKTRQQYELDLQE
jgi:NADH:ubiquinone oxidoreductase subunit K